MKRIIVFLLLYTSVIAAQTYTITFKLMDATHAIISGATITCNNVVKYSDSTGTAFFTVPASNTSSVVKYKYNIRMAHYVSINDSISLRANKTVTIIMIPITYMVVFQISDGIRPMQGVFINFANRVIQVDSISGNAIFNSVKESDSVQYTIAKADYKTITGNMPVIQNCSRLFYMTKNNTNVLTFFVKKTYDSIPIKDAMIVLGGDTSYTNDIGKVIFTNIPTGNRKQCKIYKEDYNTETLSLNINNDTTMDVYMDSIQVNFLVTNGTAYIPSADISFYDKLKLTNDSGIAIFKNIISSRGLPYIVNKKGYNTFSGNIDIDDIDVSVTVILIVSPDPSGQNLLDNIDVKEIYVYPNPLIGDLFVNSSIKIKSLYIVDMMGHPVKIINEPGANLIMIDTEDMQSGMYIIRITDSNNRIMTFKITKG